MVAKRRPWGTRKDPFFYGLSVERANAERWKRIAEHNGISASAMFDLMVENIELTMSGRPVWLPAPLVEPESLTRTPKDGELHIDAA